MLFAEAALIYLPNIWTRKNLSFSTFSPTFVIVCFPICLLYSSYLNRYVDSICTFPMTNHDLSMCLLAIYISSLKKCLLKMFAYFSKLFFVGFLEISVYSQCWFLIKFIICKYFLQFWSMPFYSVESFDAYLVKFFTHFNSSVAFIVSCVFDKVLQKSWPNPIGRSFPQCLF